MTSISRRRFLQISGAAGTLLLTPKVLRAQSVGPRVVIVGGGFAGATVAKYLKLWGNNSVNVTLVAPNASHTSCVLSNFAVTGQIKLPAITFRYDVLAAKYGINFVQGFVEEILPIAVGGQIRLADGRVLDYDRLILAPGVSFDAVPGLEQDSLLPESQMLVPHAWIAGDQTINLYNQVSTIRKKGTFIVTIPPKPFRAGAGPYERACLIADLLKRKKKAGKVIILDANPGIVAEPLTFGNAITKTYKGIIAYIPNAELRRVSFTPTATGVMRNAHVSIAGGAETTFSGDVLNVIPRQRAGKLLSQSDLGLVNVSGRWAGVNPLSYESTAVPNIHIIGDAQGTGQAKAGHMANSQAKVCADAVLRLFGGGSPHPAPVTSMALFSAISSSKAGWLSTVYQYDAVTGTMIGVPDSTAEASSANGDNFQRLFSWATNLFSDTFM